jgi:hypothetical protein
LVSLPVVWVGVVAEQRLHERAVGDRRLSELFGVCVAAFVGYRDLVGASVVLDNVGVLHRHVVGALIEVVGGVAAGGHDGDVCALKNASGAWGGRRTALQAPWRSGVYQK